jgi:Holliday junction resolvasome RuvABC endonuclease subunit
MGAPIVIGLDLSLTATGVATPEGEETWRPPGTGMARLDWVRASVAELLGYWAPGLVVVEGYSYGSRASHAHGLGELGGVVRLALADAAVTYVDIPPASLKKYATGKGNAGKGEVLTAAVRRLGYGGHDDNQADALWLRAMGMHHLGHPLTELPAAHLTGLAKVDWSGVAVEIPGVAA